MTKKPKRLSKRQITDAVEDTIRRLAPQRDVISVRTDSIRPDPNNPNRMAPAPFKVLCENMLNEGFLQPLLVEVIDPEEADSDFTYQCIDGHHRLDAAKAIGIESVHVVVWEGTPEKRALLGIAMNRLRGELDVSEVAKIFGDLTETYDVDPSVLAMSGYTAEEIDGLLKAVQNSNADEDEVLEGTTNTSPEPADEDPLHRPALLELTFASTDDLRKAKRGLRRAAGKGRELGEGLLRLLEGEES